MLNSILVIDDDAGIREMLSSVLEDVGYVVEAVKNGKEAIKTCEKSVFDAALIDIELPDIKGTELLSKLKKIQPKMIRIVITGHPSLDNAVKSVNERADGYVLKPFEVTDLLNMIKRLVAEKTDEYIHITTEAARAIENAPQVRYPRPEKW